MKRRFGRRGTAALEFALTGPIVLLSFFAVFELYRLVAAQRALDLAVIRALREASVTSSSATTSSIESGIATTVSGLTDGDSASATVSFTPAYQPGGTITISAQTTWAPAILPLWFTTVTLRSTGSVTVQN
jgi:Flp pilus assembly protein TadG